MRSFRILLTLLLVLTSSLSSMGASRSTWVYYPLATEAESGLPATFQAQQMFRRLLPILQLARQEGQILSFTPLLADGLLKLELAPGADFQLEGLTAYAERETAFGALPRPSGESAREGGGGAVFTVSLNGSCFTVEGLSSNMRVVGRVMSGAELVATSDGITDSYGDLYDCFETISDNLVRTGYKVTFKMYDTSTGFFQFSYTATAPNIKINTFNKSASQFSGTATANRAFEAILWHPLLNSTNSTTQTNKTGTVSAAGAWTVDFGSTPFRGGDSFELLLTQTTNIRFRANATVPMVSCGIGTNQCNYYGLPGQTVSLSATHAGVTYSFSGKTALDGGWFQFNIVKNTGAPVFLSIGDKIAATSVAAYNLPTLTVDIDPGTDVVSGGATANRWLMTYVFNATTMQIFSGWTQANGSGNFAYDYTPTIDFNTNHVLRASAVTVNPSSGNETFRRKGYTP